MACSGPVRCPRAAPADRRRCRSDRSAGPLPHACGRRQPPAVRPRSAAPALLHAAAPPQRWIRPGAGASRPRPARWAAARTTAPPAGLTPVSSNAIPATATAAAAARIRFAARARLARIRRSWRAAPSCAARAESAADIAAWRAPPRAAPSGTACPGAGQRNAAVSRIPLGEPGCAAIRGTADNGKPQCGPSYKYY